MASSSLKVLCSFVPHKSSPCINTSVPKKSLPRLTGKCSPGQVEGTVGEAQHGALNFKQKQITKS